MLLRVGERLGGYTIAAELPAGKSYLAEDQGGRRVVLKRLGEDCLLEGDLHPSIRMRLARVSQVPSRRVANLHGVERDRGMSYLVWDYVEGSCLEEIEDRRRLAPEILAAVESLHAWGIVHGAVHERNVIVDERGKVMLTHVSPLLFHDEQEDLRAVERLVGVADKPVTESAGGEKDVGWRSLVWAMMVIVVGILVAMMMARFN